MRKPQQAGRAPRSSPEHQAAAAPVRLPMALARQTGDPVLRQFALAEPGAARPAGVLALQRSAGNHAVSGLIQARLLVGAAGDRYEQEADRVAEQVLSMPALPPRSAQGGAPAGIQARPLAGAITPLAQREAGEGGTAGHAPGEFAAGRGVESRLAARQGAGSPLPTAVRAYMEPRFGADLSGVRLHADGEAAQLSQALGARAFTHGQDIYVGAEGLQPGTVAGRRLLAHELTHVVQQSGRSDRIARWGSFGGGTSHATITADGFHMLNRDIRKWYSKEAQEYLAAHADDMDLRVWYLGMVFYRKQVRQGWTQFRGKGMYTGELSAKDRAAMTPSQVLEHNRQRALQYDNMVGYQRNAGEAPNHSEAGMYKEDATDVNLLRRDAYIEQAVQAWRSGNRTQALHILSLALHTAQDRGAHGDGKPGLGHDPRRSQPPPPGAKTGEYFFKSNPGWKPGDPVTWGFSDCDNINKNPSGFTLALAETLQVLTRFVGGLGIDGGEKVSEQTMQAGAGLVGWKKPSWWRRAGRFAAHLFGGKDVIRP